MPLLDFFSMAGAAKGTDLPSWMTNMVGGYKFSVSYSQNLSAFLGFGRQTHVLGQELKIVTDPTSMIPFPGAKPGGKVAAGIWSLISGAAGKSELYYGRNGGMTYVGPKFDINRTADWAMTVLKDTAGKKTSDVFGQQAVDKLAVTAAIAMGLIVNGTWIGLDVAARVQYTAGKDPATGKEAPTAAFYVLNTLATSLVSRLIAVMEIIEVSAAWTNLGSGMLWIAKALLLTLSGTLLLVSIVTLIPLLIALIVASVMEKDLAQAIDDAFAGIAALGT